MHRAEDGRDSVDIRMQGDCQVKRERGRLIATPGQGRKYQEVNEAKREGN